MQDASGSESNQDPINPFNPMLKTTNITNNTNISCNLCHSLLKEKHL